MRKVTIKDIAKYVGVSTAAVSYALNGREDKVSKETLEKIHKAVKELGYVPNFSARTLVKNKSRLIGVIIPQTEDFKQLLLQNPFYSEMVSGIESKAREFGYHIILAGVDKGKNYLDVFIKRNLDGAIVMGIYKESFYEELKKASLPIVLVDSYINDNYFYKVGIDDEHGGYMATKFLIEKGHKNIALVTGTIRKDGVVEKRFSGYKKALKEANIFYNPDYVFEKSVSYEHGYESGIVISEKFNKVTAVFATADLIAAGVIKGLKENGKDIPRDISIIGFDDVSIARMLSPSLTTVKQDISAKGAKATELLVNLIEGGNNMNSKEIILPLTIIERQSVKKI